MDMKFINMAIQEARSGIRQKHGGPFGAVIVRGGQVLARGHNKVVLNNDPTQHGEMQAIMKAGRKIGSFDLSGCDLYTTGEPCPMCLCAIKWSNIANVYYGCTLADNEMIGFRDDIFDKILSVDRTKLAFKMRELGRDKCLELFSEYKNMQKKTLY